MYYSSGPAEAVKAASAIRRPPPLISKLNAALHVSVALTALSIAIILFDSSLFSFHPALMSIGYVIFMAEGVISSIMFRHIEPGAERVKAIQSHALLQLRAVVCIAIGFGVIYRNKVWETCWTPEAMLLITEVQASQGLLLWAGQEGCS